MRLQKFLSRAGVASRREAEGLISAGRVSVNGEVVTVLGTRVHPRVDDVVVDGRRVQEESPRWVIFHKPAGHLTSRSDPHGRRTIYDALPGELRELRYVGRLDMNTTGLLLLTNQGDTAHRLQHPRAGVEREYRAVVRGSPSKAVLATLREGVKLEDGDATVQDVAIVGREGSKTVLKIVLTEGRKRIVRRLCEAVGHEVVGLSRVRFGPIVLGRLPVGTWRELTLKEVEALEAC